MNKTCDLKPSLCVRSDPFVEVGGVLAQWYRSMLAGVSGSTGILLLAKKAPRSLPAFHLSFGLGALIE